MKTVIERPDPLTAPLDVPELEPPLSIEPRHTPSYDEIAAEAYARYLARGGADGGDLGDWLEAEQALQEGRGTIRGE
jgi:Protein of unknown function (DUF2934)